MKIVEVVIRFKKLSSDDDEHVFVASVRSKPRVPLSGGTFRLNVDYYLSHLSQFREKFREGIETDRSFYVYETPPSDMSELGEESEELELASLGEELYKLLPESLREGFPRLIQDCLQQERGIRIILEASALEKAVGLLTLPWELSFAQEAQAKLAQTPRLIIVRRLLDAVNQKTAADWPDYRVLHVIADDPTFPGREIFLELAEMERLLIPQAISHERYSLAHNLGSVEQMREKLGGQQVLHFLGHGEQDSLEKPNFQRGYLKFINSNGKPQPVTGEHLQHLLAEKSTIQLVVLNACHGGSAAASNIALQLTYNGLPYVVAMQEEIHIKAASAFIQAFYEALAKGEPIDVAVTLGRTKIVTDLPGAPDWCLPVLYTNQGIEKPSLHTQIAERIWEWFSQEAAHTIPRASFVFGILFLFVGLLLLLSGVSPTLPDMPFLPLTASMVLGAPIITIGVYLEQQNKLPTDWNFSAQTALIMRLFAAASVGLGLSLFCFLWLGLILALSLGFWTILSPLAQLLLLMPAFAVSLLISYAQTLGFYRAFMNDSQVKTPKIVWADLSVILAGYIIMLTPLALWFIFPWLITPPIGTLLAGILLLRVAKGN